MKKYMILALFALFSQIGYSQTQLSGVTINSLSGSFQGSTSSMSITIGELVIEELATTSTGISLGGGFISTISVVTDIENSPELKIYPNPTVSTLTVSATTAIKIDLYDSNGQHITSVNSNDIIQISFESYSDGLYYLRIQNLETLKITSHKIIKSNK